MMQMDSIENQEPQLLQILNDLKIEFTTHEHETAFICEQMDSFSTKLHVAMKLKF